MNGVKGIDANIETAQTPTYTRKRNKVIIFI